MRKEVIDWGVYKDLVEYGTHIVWEVPDFKGFAMACVDHLGTQCAPLIKSVYSLLSESPFDLPKKDMTSYQDYGGISSDTILEWYEEFKERERQRAIENEFKENIDELQFLVREYRDSEEYQKVLNFIGSFKWLAPYNAMLVQMQLPGARLVLTGKNWLYYNRRPKPNAQRLITLKNFGPVQCMFDYGDTEPIPGCEEYEFNAIMENWLRSVMKSSGSPDDKLKQLKANLPVLGIYLDDNFMASDLMGGYIKAFRNRMFRINLSREDVVTIRSEFILSVNRNADTASQFHTICHELGHLFCQHIYYDRSKQRDLTVQQREFEAETVAWIVCRRQGVSNSSEQYLAGYTRDGQIPVCSTEMIMKAVTKIEELLDKQMDIRKSPYYKCNKEIRNLVDRELSRIQSAKKPVPNSLFPGLK